MRAILRTELQELIRNIRIQKSHQKIKISSRPGEVAECLCSVSLKSGGRQAVMMTVSASDSIH